MVFPLWFRTRLSAGRPVFCSIVNAAADGKRLRAIDALVDLNRRACAL
jgi:hypothetical protein